MGKGERGQNPLIHILRARGKVEEDLRRGTHLPMGGVADSLNVSVDAGVVLYEVVRQRAEKPSALGFVTVSRWEWRGMAPRAYRR